MRRLAGARALPSITELERLWYELLREMTDAGKVVKFNTDVLQVDNTKVNMEVVRVGPFTAQSNGQYLGYLSSQKSLAQLNGELLGEFRAIGRAIAERAGRVREGGRRPGERRAARPVRGTARAPFAASKRARSSAT